MNILVTGGCGFIGSHLVDELVARNHQVTVLDNLSTGTLDNLNVNATFVEGSVCDEQLTQALLSESDFCFHLAAVVSVIESTKKWVKSNYINNYGTLNILNSARKTYNGCKNVPVVFASTAAVYGDSNVLPLKEDMKNVPLSPYGCDKLAGEMNALIAKSLYEVPTRSFRFFNVFGPRQNPGNPYSGVIAKFMGQFLSGDAVTIYGDGSQTRDFIYVTDVVRALVDCIESPVLSGRVFNLCGERETSVMDIYNILGEITGRKIDIQFMPREGFDIYRSCGSSEKAKSLLNFSANIKIADGLQDLWHYYCSKTSPV